MATAFLNGTFVDLAEARVGALDAGLQHGVGLFETMLGGVLPGAGVGEEPGAWVLHSDEHLERLVASATELGLTERLNAGALERAITATVARSGLARARVRLTVTGGSLNLLRRDASESGAARAGNEPTILIVASAATEYPEAMLARGVSVAIADSKANPFNLQEGHKTLNYWWRLRELQLAAAKGAGEAIVFSVTNHVCGGCVSNILVCKDGEVLTPIARGEEAEVAARADEAERGTEGKKVAGGGGGVLPSPVRPGVARLWAIRHLAGEGTLVRRRLLTIDDLLEADEVMLTNSSWGVLPVIQVEGRQIASGAPGPQAVALVRAWSDEVAAAMG